MPGQDDPGESGGNKAKPPCGEGTSELRTSESGEGGEKRTGEPLDLRQTVDEMAGGPGERREAGDAESRFTLQKTHSRSVRGSGTFLPETLRHRPAPARKGPDAFTGNRKVDHRPNHSDFEVRGIEGALPRYVVPCNPQRKDSRERIRHAGITFHRPHPHDAASLPPILRRN